MHPESIAEFYQRIWLKETTRLNHHEQRAYFSVFMRGASCQQPSTIQHHNFYKISLLIGKGYVHYPNRSIAINRPAILISNPLIPYAWEPLTEEQTGYFCLFNEAFIRPEERSHSFGQSPLFKVGDDKVFFLDEYHRAEITEIFVKMLEEIASNHQQKWAILRAYTHLIMYKVMAMQPATDYTTNTTNAERIVALFLTLLNQRFSLEEPSLKTAKDYAFQLSVHVNHLNRVLKQYTGKTTSMHIAERTIIEANSLLRNTPLTVNEVAYRLGFEYPSYFSRFYKKHTGKSPSNSFL